MFCPRCGQRQVNEETKFCSRCGFLMQGMLEVVGQGGLPKEILERRDPEAISPRRRGLKQGGLLFLSGGVIVPLIGLLTEMLNGDEVIIGIAAILTFLGGFLRMVYALIFQSGVPTLENEGIVQTFQKDLLGKTAKQKELPPQQTEPATTFHPPTPGNWKETNDLESRTMTENATKPLERN